AGVGPREKRRRSHELLERVGLWEHRRHRLAQLSGGQQQRVAIAVALANRPTLLLGDEPTGEVDSTTAHELLDLFGDLNQTYGLTTIIVTHDPQIARRVDRVVAIRDGKTSTETIRRVSQLEEAMVGGQRAEGLRQGHEQEDAYHEYIVLDSAGRLQVPREYLEQFGIGDRVTLEVGEEGILIRPVAGREAAVTPLLEGFGDEEPPPTQPKGLRGWWARMRQK
ncbi:MAG: ATP-binding cassette domain-containing protein, partial [Anaerolineae bacterium]